MKFAGAVLFLVLACPVLAQTYQVGSSGQVTQKSKSGQSPSSGQQLGWGSNIQNARLARAAQLALQRGDHAVAFDYAQRAAQSAPSDPQLWFLLGYSARLDNRYSESVDAFRRGLSLAPSSVSGLSGLAQTYAVMGRTAEAETLLKKVLAIDPRQIDDLLVLGNLYLQAGDYNDAITWLSKAEQYGPNARSELLLAIVYEHLNQMDQARHFLDLARSRAPNNPDVERSLAGYYRTTGDYQKAIQALSSIHTPPPDVVAELADTYQLNGNLKESARLYEQAANALPHDLEYQLAAAQAEVTLNDFDHAATYLQRAQAINPSYYRLHAIRGEIAELQDHEAEAARQYSTAIANLPPSPVEGPLYPIQLHVNLEILYKDLNETDLAQHQLQIAEAQIGAINEQGDQRPAFLRLRAQIKMDAGDVNGALADASEAVSLRPNDPNNLQLDGDVLMKMGRPRAAIAVYKKALSIDPRSRLTLTSLGYASRAIGDDHQAERYFQLLAKDYPDLYVPYLALGDLYTARKDYRRAEEAYVKAYARDPRMGMIVAGGINAGVESHDLRLAGMWQKRVTPGMQMVPEVLREEERYFRFTGDYAESAHFGSEAIKVMPGDRDVVVYLGYDLLYLDKYQQLLDLTNKYNDLLPHEPDIPLLAGYVERHDGNLDAALKDFSEAIDRDPGAETAYVNRGYVLNNLHRPAEAAASFEVALKEEPHDGQAHLGLAYADLDLDHPGAAIRETRLAEVSLGDSVLVHSIRATAYGREQLLPEAIGEYRAALRFTPDDPVLHAGLGNALFGERRYRQAIDQLNVAERLSPGDPGAYALLARSWANLHDSPQALRYVSLAENHAHQEIASGKAPQSLESDVYLSTGEALSTLGEHNAAMQRFSRALSVPHSNRVGVRLAIAQLMAQQGNTADAEREIALAQMEAEAGDTPAPTGDQDIEAADVLRTLHEYDLSQQYLHRAQIAGAPEIPLRIALADTYLAQGDTPRAAAALSGAENDPDAESNYQFLMAQASLYEQQHHGFQALSAFARAASAAGDDQAAEQSLLQAGGNVGYRVNRDLSVLSDFSVEPIFEDSTVYVLDAKTFGNPPPDQGSSVNTVELPRPRSSIQTQWTGAYHLHLFHLPAPAGFFQLRNARGQISDPATNRIVKRSTYDFNMNFGLNPTISVGHSTLTFSSGIQGTIRRDTISPAEMNQNIFRVFTYLQTSSFLNAVSADGYFTRDSGPFTDSPIYEHAISGAINFHVGAPWAKTFLITGWGMNDQRFHETYSPSMTGTTENYYTSSYVGLSRRFGTRLSMQGIFEELRSWRVVPYFTAPAGSIIYSGTAQAIRPAGTINFSPARYWDIQAAGSWESTRNFHLYDMTQDGISVSYTRPFSRTFDDETGAVHLRYPIRFAAGLQEETFANFPDLPGVPSIPYLTPAQNSQFRPYVSITIF